MARQTRGVQHSVVVVGFTDELSSMVQEILQEEGYLAQSIASNLDVPEQVLQAGASVVMIALGRLDEGLAVIDRLRTSEPTSALPVIAMSTVPAQQDQAQMSGNVAAVLAMPFDIDEMLDTVRAVLSQRPFEARVRSVPADLDRTRIRAAEILLQAERNVVLGWLQGIRMVEPFASRTDLPTREFLDTVPRILNGLILLLRQGPRPDILHTDEDARGRIRAHALIRRKQGLGADAVVREYQLLREAIRERLQRDMPAQDVLVVLPDIHSVLDEAVRLTVTELGEVMETSSNAGS